MKHFRDPITGRCAVCESKGLDPAMLHNGIIYPSHTPRLQNEPKVIDIRSENLSPSPQKYTGNSPVASPRYAHFSPENPESEAARSTISTASTTQVTFATQTSFANDEPQTPPSPQERRDRKKHSPRYSPEGSPSKAGYTDHRLREPQVWFIGEGSTRSRLDRSPSPRRRDQSPDRNPKPKRSPRDRKTSPYNDKRQKREHEDTRRQDQAKQKDFKKGDANRDISYNRHKGYNKTSRSTGRKCCRGCRSWCSWRKCCMIFWVTLLVLLALGALATAIYFAVAGAENANSVQDLTIRKDPRYLIYGVDQPCRTTVITTTEVPITTDPAAPTAAPTTTLILCYDTTRLVVLDGSETRISNASRTTSSVYVFLVVAVVTRMLCGV